MTTETKDINQAMSQEPRTIYLNRQGVSRSLNTAQTKGLKYFISIHQWQDTDRFIGEVCYSGDREQWKDKNGQVAFVVPKRQDVGVNPISMDTMIKRIEEGIKEHFKEDVKLSRHIQAYMYKDDAKPPYEHTLTDFYFAKAVYCGYSDSIRATDNTCLIAWKDGDINQPDFKVDALNYEKHQLTFILEEAHKEFLKSHNQRSEDKHNKGWLAWLISEKMKKYNIDKPLRPIKSMIPESFWNNAHILSEGV